MGGRLEAGMEFPVGVIDRISDTLLASAIPLEREALALEAARISAREAPLAGPELIGQVVDGLVGLGPVEPLLRDPAVTDVLVNGPDEVWVERSGVLELTDVRFPDAAAVVAAVERVITPLGLRLDRSAPAVDARLADGSRLHAVIPPASVDRPVVAVRRFVPAVADLAALEAAGSVDRQGALELRRLVRDRVNLLVSGGTGSGKTTLLNVLSAEIDPGERVVVIEDSAELRLSGHVVRLEARPPNSEGTGAITLRDLVRSALRLRPDRIVIGEVRGPEALDLVSALNTGHDGSMATIHANSPDEALWRLETLALSGERRVPAGAVRRQIRSAIGAVVQVERRQGLRRLVEIRAEVGS
jgi:pilus assembly protein CpaF